MPTIARNKQIGHNFKILEEFEAGLALTGAEVKSIKTGHISLKGAFISIKDGQPYIIPKPLSKVLKTIIQMLTEDYF